MIAQGHVEGWLVGSSHMGLVFGKRFVVSAILFGKCLDGV